MKKILQKDAPVLRKVAEEVSLSDINSPKIRRVISEMKSALDSQDDGVAIAAPQVGYPLRIFVVSKKVEAISKKVFEINKTDQKNSSGINPTDLVFINPIIKKLSKEKRNVEEGCLSVRYLYGKVKRASKATIFAYDETGKKFTKGGSGLLAQIFQHETDHLEGVLFTDKATDVVDMSPPKTKHAKV